MAKPEERRVSPTSAAHVQEAAGGAKRGDSCRRGDGRCRAWGFRRAGIRQVSTCAEADEREVEGATFFANTACRWFPCPRDGRIPNGCNCLCCFCPLYPFGERRAAATSRTRPPAWSTCSACRASPPRRRRERLRAAAQRTRLAALAKRPRWWERFSEQGVRRGAACAARQGGDVRAGRTRMIGAPALGALRGLCPARQPRSRHRTRLHALPPRRRQRRWAVQGVPHSAGPTSGAPCWKKKA